MNYRSLLVLLDNSASCAARTQLAMRLAREQDCHLVGLASTGLIDIPPSTEAATSLANYSVLAWMRCAIRPNGRRSAFATNAMCPASSRSRQ